MKLQPNWWLRKFCIEIDAGKHRFESWLHEMFTRKEHWENKLDSTVSTRELFSKQGVILFFSLYFWTPRCAPPAQKPFQYQIHQNRKITVQTPTTTGAIQVQKNDAILSERHSRYGKPFLFKATRTITHQKNTVVGERIAARGPKRI